MFKLDNFWDYNKTRLQTTSWVNHRPPKPSDYQALCSFIWVIQTPPEWIERWEQNRQLNRRPKTLPQYRYKE